MIRTQEEIKKPLLPPMLSVTYTFEFGMIVSSYFEDMKTVLNAKRGK